MNWLRRLVSSTPSQQAQSQGSAGSSIDVLEAYGAVLADRAPAPGCVADERELPFSKAVIKNAIRAELRNTDDPRLREYLKAGFMCLSSWQPNIGPAHRGSVLPPAALANDPRQLSDWILSQSSDAQWAQVVAEESQALKAELVRDGLW